MDNKLLRSKKDRVIAGVCGGVADYLKIDSTVVRIIWAAMIFIGGTGIIAYIIAAIIMPESKDENLGENSGFDSAAGQPDTFNTAGTEWPQQSRVDPAKSRNLVGAILIVIGALLLGRQFLHWIDFRFIIPLILIGIGAFVIYKGGRNSV